MQRGHKLTQPSGLDLPVRLDPSGMPCVESGPTRTRAASAHRRSPRSLPGLSPTSLIASVEEVATTDGGVTWKAQDSGSSSYLQAVSFIDSDRGWAVGYEGTILATTNGGN